MSGVVRRVIATVASWPRGVASTPRSRGQSVLKPCPVAARSRNVSCTASPQSEIGPAPLSWPSRSHECGRLRSSEVGEKITVCGWVDKYRNLGGLLFLDIRDHTGILQVVSDAGNAEAPSIGEKLRQEWVVSITGTLQSRKDVNEKIPTGAVELIAEEILVLNDLKRPLPFPISESDEQEIPREELRLKNRVLDLRRPSMASKLRARAQIVRCLRRRLEDVHGFQEVETPILTRSTPEGARDYIVPSRIAAGSWYALPQSPQLFKQMLMAAGVDRYYQVARCFRDEDLRADRQPEFTQLDVEVAFMNQDDILSLAEDVLVNLFATVLGVHLQAPFQRMTYADAMEQYGTDKPDLRFGLRMATINEAVKDCGFKIFADTVDRGGTVKALVVPKGQRISNSRLKPKGDVAAEAMRGGAAGLAFVRVTNGDVIEGAKAIREGLSPDQAERMIQLCGANEGDLLLIAAGEAPIVNRSLDMVRRFLGHQLGEVEESAHSLAWIVDWPMFEYNSDEDRLEALHHPFTAPQDVSGDIAAATAFAYDVVYNGIEIGGGSLRIYRRDVQQKVFQAIGLTEADAEAKFGYLLDAFDTGAPPHGGFAFGLDRIAMLMSRSASIRDVIAFPKTTAAQCLLTGSPAGVDDAQLSELHVARVGMEEPAES